MQPPTKDQSDIGVDNPTIDCTLPLWDGSPNTDMARQEYAQEADITYMLSRFGIVPKKGSPTYGEWDDSIDLQTALESVREAREGYKSLPEDMRAKFTSMEEMLRAIDNGSLVIKDGEVPVIAPTQTELLQARLDKLEKAGNTQAPSTEQD